MAVILSYCALAQTWYRVASHEEMIMRALWVVPIVVVSFVAGGALVVDAEWAARPALFAKRDAQWQEREASRYAEFIESFNAREAGWRARIDAVRAERDEASAAQEEAKRKQAIQVLAEMRPIYGLPPVEQVAARMQVYARHGFPVETDPKKLADMAEQIELLNNLNTWCHPEHVEAGCLDDRLPLRPTQR